MSETPRSLVGFSAKMTFNLWREGELRFREPLLGAAGSPRPILVNVWYPADGGRTPMTRASYLRPPEAPPAGALAAALGSYARGITAQEDFGAEASALSPDQRRRFADYLATS